ncbi:MAG: DUF4142 domain-containing protein [Pseudomonadota bacterium]|nr:DUF4142 domain-containing protein [Pseudomonadota bacterium]
MNRTSIAAAIAALFLISASSLHAQTPGAGTGAGGTTTSGTSAPAAGSTARGTSASAARGGDTGSSATKLDRGDRKFLENAALGGMKEVEAGRAASGKASDPAVKAFADRMVKDHGDANKKLMDIATSKGLTPASDLRGGDRRHIDKMSKMDADKLDRAYMKDMVKDHKKDIKDFEKEAKNGKDPDVKRFASDTLPVLQEHLRMAQDTESKLKGGGSARTRGSSGAGGSGSGAMGAGTGGSGSPAAAGGATSPSGMGSGASGTPSSGSTGGMGKDSSTKK